MVHDRNFDILSRALSLEGFIGLSQRVRRSDQRLQIQLDGNSQGLNAARFRPGNGLREGGVRGTYKPLSKGSILSMATVLRIGTCFRVTVNAKLTLVWWSAFHIPLQYNDIEMTYFMHANPGSIATLCPMLLSFTLPPIFEILPADS